MEATAMTGLVTNSALPARRSAFSPSSVAAGVDRQKKTAACARHAKLQHTSAAGRVVGHSYLSYRVAVLPSIDTSASLSRADADGKRFFHGDERIESRRDERSQIDSRRDSRRPTLHDRSLRIQATLSTPSTTSSVQGIDRTVGTKSATIRITTGNNLNDGMLGKARIVIIGDGKEDEDGPRAPPSSTGTSWFGTSIDGYDLGFQLWKSGSTMSVTINDLPRNVNPTVILLYNDSPQDKWFVRKVEVETEAYTADGGGNNGKLTSYVFPCHSFVVSGNKPRTFFLGNSLLPSQTPPMLASLYREGALDDQMITYQFEEYNDLSLPKELADRSNPFFRPRLRPYPKRQADRPGGVPVDDNFDLSKNYDFLGAGSAAIAKSAIADPLAISTNTQWRTVGGLTAALFGGPGGFKVPAVLKSGVDWKSDKEFGRQTVAGLDPMEIRSIEALPEDFSVTEAELGSALPSGLSLAGALKAKRVFMTDFSFLEPFMQYVNRPPSLLRSSRHLYAPRCLFLRDDNDDLVAIAVQLERGGNVYTRAKDKSSGKWQWTLAKAYVASAESGTHQVGRHFLECHAVCEVYLIALRRRISEWHPLFKLLIPHFRFTMTINFLARRLLINAGTIIETTFTLGSKAMEASAEMFKSWRFKDQALPENLKKRGVYDKSVLPYYPYRDTGMLIWNAMHKYALGYLKIYYGQGEDAKQAIANDKELERWWADVKFGLSKSESTVSEEEDWPAMETLEDLAFICTTIMWTTSAQHAAINFSQYDYSAFAPNRPSEMRKPMPASVDEKAFMSVMPLPRDQVMVMSTVDLLSRYSEDEEYIGRLDQTAYDWLVDPAAREVYKEFSADLDEAEKIIDQMNEEDKAKGRLPYKYLFPRTNRAEFGSRSDTPFGTEGITNSISI
ncbi:hypothetical protein CBR_g45631 [Chara braunii]|uniref:Lipoxygenase domain-containing protein n=1 Tax=Chara braunii TaxID=69332 RepID=A0A388LZ91_CHABU|nr:hypothetical protein CBR_g45631 [Chara braunii]|eukprot:GBG87573.1 hypothetical protein CBR_g45631 [Chara braunii]